MRKKIRFSKSEMAGFIILILLFSAMGLMYQYRELIFSSKKQVVSISVQELNEIEKFKEQIKADSVSREKRFSRENNVNNRALKPFAFDPNTIDSSSLIKMGFHEWQVNNLLKYRRKGGRWRKPDDFSKLYGLSKTDFEQLKPFIYIRKTKSEIALERHREQNDSIRRTYPKKLKKGTTLSLNEADTVALKGIPGIGSYYASKICRYRERLGGFIKIEQLKEIEGLPENIEEWFTISENPRIKQIKINKTSFKGLVRHPYLNYEQVKVICNYIQKYGKINNWEELSNNENFTKEDFERLSPYFTFE